MVAAQPAGLGGSCCLLVHLMHRRSSVCVCALPGLSLSLADSLGPDLIREQSSKNRYFMFQESRYSLCSGENRLCMAGCLLGWHRGWQQSPGYNPGLSVAF